MTLLHRPDQKPIDHGYHGYHRFWIHHHQALLHPWPASSVPSVSSVVHSPIFIRLDHTGTPEETLVNNANPGGTGRKKRMGRDSKHPGIPQGIQ
jgi:hypothetical protein